MLNRGTLISGRLCKRKICKCDDRIVRTECRNTYGVEYLNSYRGLNASGFTVEGPWQTISIVSVEVVSWWMLDLANIHRFQFRSNRLIAARRASFNGSVRSAE